MFLALSLHLSFSFHHCLSRERTCILCQRRALSLSSAFPPLNSVTHPKRMWEFHLMLFQRSESFLDLFQLLIPPWEGKWNEEQVCGQVELPLTPMCWCCQMRLLSLTTQDPGEKFLLIPTPPWIPTGANPDPAIFPWLPGNDGGQHSWGNGPELWFFCLQERREENIVLYIGAN